MNSNKVAAFIDYESLFYGMLNEHGAYYNLTDLINILTGFGRLVFARAYANFKTPILKDEPQRLDNVAISAIQCDASGKKNYTDFYMLNDIFETVIDNQDINTYILVTGDGHFKGVLAKLKFKHNKNVIVISVKGCANNALRSFDLHELEPQITRSDIIKYIDNKNKEYGYITFQQAIKKAEAELNLNIFPVLSSLVDDGVIKKSLLATSNGMITVLSINDSDPKVAQV